MTIDRKTDFAKFTFHFSLFTINYLPLRERVRIEILLHLLLIVVGDGDEHIAEHDAEAVDRAHLRHVDDIRAVSTQELWVRQIILQFLHTHQRHDLLAALQTDTHLILQTLHIEDIVEADTQQFVFALDEHDTIIVISLTFLKDIIPILRFFRGTKEILITNGF